MSDDTGGPDLGDLLSQAMEMQQQVVEAQQQAAETELEGVSGGGAVRVVVTGAWEFRRVEIAPAAVDPDDVEMLQDLVLAALHDAVDKIATLQEQSLGGFGDVLAGSGLGDVLGIAPGDQDDDSDAIDAASVEVDVDDERG